MLLIKLKRRSEEDQNTLVADIDKFLKTQRNKLPVGSSKTKIKEALKLLRKHFEHHNKLGEEMKKGEKKRAEEKKRLKEKREKLGNSAKGKKKKMDEEKKKGAENDSNESESTKKKAQSKKG